MLAVLVGTAIGIGLASKMINSGIKGILALAASYIVIAGAIYIISASSQNLTWETIGIFSAIVGLIQGKVPSVIVVSVCPKPS